MTPEEAKEVLRLHRPAIDPCDDRVERALHLLETDPELARWWTEEQAFDASIATALEATPVPSELQAELLAHRRTDVKRSRKKLLHPAFWGSLSAAAAVFLVAAFFFRDTLIENQLLGYHPQWSKMEHEPTFPDAMASYIARSRVVLDFMSDDLSAIRETLKGSSAPRYASPAEALEALAPIGCKTFQWQDQPVTLVCFELPDNRVMHLFIIDTPNDGTTTASDLATLSRRHDRATAFWTDGRRNYVLVGSHPGVEVAPFLPVSVRASA